MTTGKLQTLDRGIEALLLVAEAPEGLTVGEIASRLDLHRAVTYRIVAATYQLGAPTVDSIRSYALPVLERLAETTGATAFLSMADAEECEVVMTAEPREVAIAIHYRVGRRHPLTRGAAGIAILAARPETSMDTPDIRFARYHGYSITQGQLHKGAVGVSSAVRLSSGGRAPQEFSIGVVALEDLKLDEAAQAVVDAAQSLSKAVGGELM